MKNTKYCHVCRLERDLKFIGPKTTKCWGCDKPFAPLNRNDMLCSKCDLVTGTADVEGVCGICDASGPLYRQDIRICMACLRDPDKRGRVYQAIVKKVKWQRKHPPTEPIPAPLHWHLHCVERVEPTEPLDEPDVEET